MITETIEFQVNNRGYSEAPPAITRSRITAQFVNYPPPLIAGPPPPPHITIYVCIFYFLSLIVFLIPKQ